MIRTALYIRVSTEEQAMHGLSLEAQDADLTNYCEKNDLFIVGRYIDEGITARKKMTNRKALQRLLVDVKAGKIDLIIFTKIDRWMRNIYDYHRVQEVLEKHKVNWRTIFENYDTATAAGRLHINIMLSVAQDEADRTSERIKMVFANKIQKGEYTTNKVPFGYSVKDSKVFKNEDKREATEEIFSKFFECHSVRGTLTHIQNKFGVKIDAQTFRKIFNNALYCGEYKGIKDFCEPYITREQFDEIQRIMKDKNVKRTASGLDYVFTGMLVCPKCGRFLGSGYNRRSDNSKIPVYRCPTRVKTDLCDFKPVIMEKTIEEYLFRNLLAELDNVQREHEVKKLEKKAVVNTEKAAEKIRKKLNKLKELYVNDMIDMDTYKKDYEDLNKQLADLLTDVREEEKEVDIEAIKNLLSRSTEEIYQTLTAEAKRTFWRGFIDRIIVYDREHMKPIFLKK